MRIISVFFGFILLFNPFSHAVSNCATLEECRKELSAASVESRYEIIEHLAVFKKEAVPDLIAALEDESRSIQVQAIEALGEIGPDAKDAAPGLIKFFEAGHPHFQSETQLAASFALVKIGPEILPLLISSLNTKNSILQDNLATTLAKMGKIAIPELIPLLESPEHYFKKGSSKALFLIGPDAKDAVPGLIGLLKDDDIQTRSNAAQALGRIGPATKEITTALMIALKENPPTTEKVLDYKLGILEDAPSARGAIVSALGSMGPAAAKAIPDLWEEFKRNTNAAIALSKIDPATIKKTVPILIKKLETSDSGNPEGVSMVLGGMGRGAVPLLITALTDGNSAATGIREYIVDALGVIGPDAIEASPVLVKLYKEECLTFHQDPDEVSNPDITKLGVATCVALWNIDEKAAKSIEDPPFNCSYPIAD